MSASSPRGEGANPGDDLQAHAAYMLGRTPGMTYRDWLFRCFREMSATRRPWPYNGVPGGPDRSIAVGLRSARYAR